ncbi:hypothetical protein HYC85_009321 [Camellia sinensis]|uniref:FMN-dependent dehydrogenase domain-containing protein n=1 Tax=Camellia sinensis TaxID=4442 RepID=A0A7J7HFW9_CAMSI|nr:hypothetical protein HYC85_009321 [Camellia sinensis]
MFSLLIERSRQPEQQLHIMAMSCSSTCTVEEVASSCNADKGSSLEAFATGMLYASLSWKVGRPVIYGLAAKGEYGVRRVIEMLKDELELTIALSGCPTVNDIIKSLSSSIRAGQRVIWTAQSAQPEPIRIQMGCFADTMRADAVWNMT